MANFCNREMSKAVLGQTLTTDTQGSTGTYAAGKIQAEVRQDILEADKKGCEGTIRLQVLRPLVGFNFGWDKAIPKFALLIQDSPDLKTDSEMVKNLASVPGAAKRIPAVWINEHFGIPEPQEGEETLGEAAAEDQPPAALKSKERGVAFSRQDVQTELDNLTQAASEEAQAYLAKMLAPVKELIFSGAELPEIRTELLQLYPRMDTRSLATIMGQVRIMSNLRGRVDG